MEVVGWSRTVDNDPVTVVDLTNFKVICVLLKDKEQERRGEEVTNNVIHVVFMEYLSIMAIWYDMSLFRKQLFQNNDN